MTTRRFLAAVAITALAVTSCSNGDDTIDPPTENIGPTATPEPGDPTSAAPTTTPPATTTSEPTSEPTPTIPEVEAANEDEQAVIDTAKTLLEEVEPQLQADPESDVSILDNWATGQAKGITLDSIEYTRSQNERLIGEIHFTALEISVDGELAILEGCLDAMQADFVDDEGNSVLGDDRYASLVSLTLIRDDDTKNGWIVSEKRAGGTPCTEW